MEWISHGDKRYRIGNIVKGTAIALDGADGCYTCDEQSVMYKLVKLLCCTPETNVTLCVNYTSIIKRRKRRRGERDWSSNNVKPQ